MLLSLFFSVITVTENIFVQREGCSCNVAVSEHSKVSCYGGRENKRG